MTEQKTNRTEEQLTQQLRKSKGGKLGGKLLSLLGGVIAVAGMIFGGNLVLVLIGGVLLGVGQMVQGSAKGKASHILVAIPPSENRRGPQRNPAPNPSGKPLTSNQGSYQRKKESFGTPLAGRIYDCEEGESL